MITRKIGSILRGKATPFQLIAACVLGALLGFAPEPTRAPALYVLLVGLLLVVNANLGLALLTAGCARVLSWVLVPVTFQVGRFLLDGPTSGLAHEIVNAPVLAWCGLHVYVVAGGQLVGLVGGLLTGLLVARGVGSFRRRMVAAAAHPSKHQELMERRWARAGIWLFFGGGGKGSWEDKLEKRVGNPVRIWGVALLVVLVIAGFVARGTWLQAFAEKGVKKGLEQANGATVDIGGVQLNLSDGIFGVRDLAVADPNALDKDLIQGELLEADFDQVDLLRRRVHVAKLVLRDAASGAPREVPGERVTPAAKDVYDSTRESLPNADDVSLEDVLAEAEVWRDRLAQARRWLDRLAPQKETGEEDDETFRERMARKAMESGWLSIEADHLIDEAPNFRLSDLAVEGLTLAALPGRVFDLRGFELSSQPWLLDASPKMTFASRDQSIRFEVDLAPASRAGGDGALKMHWTGLALDGILAQLRFDAPPLEGGTIDLEIDGGWQDGRIGFVDLPMKVTLRDTTLTMGGLERTPLALLELPVGLSGPIDAPRVRFDGSDFADALKDAGKQELANKLRQKFGLELPEGVGELGEELEEKAKKALEDKAKEALEGKTKGALEGLFGGKKKDDDG